MGNIATRVEDQIAQLAARGMELDLPSEKIKEILLDIGYYRLGFYWYPFEIDSNHNFREGTKFSDIVELYYLDVDLRYLLLKYINRIEISFRTKVVYYVSNKYRLSPTWFVDPKVMDKEFIKEFDKYYNADFKKDNYPIKNHHQKYINDRYAPAWKTLEFFTFGSILKIFKSLNDENIKQRISGLYVVKNLDKFTNIFNTIVFARNCCAHGTVIFDLKATYGIAKVPGIQFNNNNRHSLDTVIKVTNYILSSVSENRAKEMSTALENLFNYYKGNETIKNLIESKIGYVYAEPSK